MILIQRSNQILKIK